MCTCSYSRSRSCFCSCPCPCSCSCSLFSFFLVSLPKKQNKNSFLLSPIVFLSSVCPSARRPVGPSVRRSVFFLRFFSPSAFVVSSSIRMRKAPMLRTRAKPSKSQRMTGRRRSVSHTVNQPVNAPLDMTAQQHQHQTCYIPVPSTTPMHPMYARKCRGRWGKYLKTKRPLYSRPE